MNKTYAYHKPSPESIEKIAELRKGFSDLQDLVSKHCACSREHEIASLYLEDAAMWAIKGVVLNDPKSAVDPDATFGTGPVLPVVPSIAGEPIQPMSLDAQTVSGAHAGVFVVDPPKE